jgi:hypothetical protein
MQVNNTFYLNILESPPQCNNSFCNQYQNYTNVYPKFPKMLASILGYFRGLFPIRKMNVLSALYEDRNSQRLQLITMDTVPWHLSQMMYRIALMKNNNPMQLSLYFHFETVRALKTSTYPPLGIAIFIEDPSTTDNSDPSTYLLDST